MINWFRNLSGTMKVVCVVVALMAVLVIGLLVAVVATGGFNGIV